MTETRLSVSFSGSFFVFLQWLGIGEAKDESAERGGLELANNRRTTSAIRIVQAARAARDRELGRRILMANRTVISEVMAIPSKTFFSGFMTYSFIP